MEVEKFFGCYLLYSLNEKYKGRIYIGFTVDPNRRIKQHNRGLKAGGAWKTNNKGPWDMVLVVHGFPNDVAALRFEWAWQNPLKSRRLRHVSRKLPRESALKYRFRVMSEMLRVGPWKRLPLTIQWLNISYKQEFDVSRIPPLHIPICVGPIVPQKAKDINEEKNDEDLKFCFICHKVVTKDKKFICFTSSCKEAFHVTCLGRTSFSSQSEGNEFLLPIDVSCPNCSTVILWGDVIRYVSGCYREENSIE